MTVQKYFQSEKKHMIQPLFRSQTSLTGWFFSPGTLDPSAPRLQELIKRCELSQELQSVHGLFLSATKLTQISRSNSRVYQGGGGTLI